MKRTTGAIAPIITALAVAGCTAGSTGSAPTAPPIGVRGPTTPLATSNTDCNQAIISDKPVTARALKACNIANVPTSYPCLHGPSVYEAYIPTGDDALLRLGYEPIVYGPGSLYVSEIKQLCGDPIDPSMTAPVPPLSQSEVKALFRSANAATTVPNAVGVASTRSKA